MLDLLHRRFDPDGGLAGGLPASFMSPQVVAPLVAGESAEAASDRAQALAEAICTAPVDLSDRSRIASGETLEEVFYVSLAPEQTWLGWLLHMMQAPRPFVLSVHVQATERYRERMAQKRRYKRIYGVNRGVEQRGRPLDPDARVQEQEAAELNDELATSAGAGIYRVSIYCALRSPAPTRTRRRCRSCARPPGGRSRWPATRGFSTACSPRRGCGSRRCRSAATSPRRRRKYVSRNVGDTFPLVGTSCGSPQGIPLGYALPGRTLERLDPFDPAHPNHLLLINGMSGAGKTMAAIILLVRALAQGASGFIIDRAGHFEFLCSLIPGARVAADRRGRARDQLVGRRGPRAGRRGEDRLSARAARAAAGRASRRPRHLRAHRS